jgi:CHAD domain-containing protein
MARLFQFTSTRNLAPHALARAFGISRRAHAHAASGCYLDDVNGTLDAQGWVLHCTCTARCRLELRRRDHAVRRAAVDVEQCPRSVAELPHSVLRRELERRLGRAQLRAHPRWHGDRYENTCRDDQGKLTCTLRITRRRRAGNDDLPDLIELIPQRGYARESAALLARPSAGIELHALEIDDYYAIDEAAALRAAMHVQPDDDAGPAVASILIREWVRMRDALPFATMVLEVEAVHDFRVALRRTRSLARAFFDQLGDTASPAPYRALVALARATSELRDIDVLRDDLGAARWPDVPEASAAVTTFIARARARSAEILRASLQTPSHLRLRRAWLAALVRRRQLPSRRRQPLKRTVDRAVRHAFARIRRDTARFAAERDVDSMHELRKHFKRLRYIIEPFTALYPGAPADELRDEIKALQDRLGRLCDRAAAARLLAQWRAGSQRDAALGRELKCLHAQLARIELAEIAPLIARFDRQIRPRLLAELLETRA